jgi:hypothetical protein
VQTWKCRLLLRVPGKGKNKNPNIVSGNTHSLLNIFMQTKIFTSTYAFICTIVTPILKVKESLKTEMFLFAATNSSCFPAITTVIRNCITMEENPEFKCVVNCIIYLIFVKYIRITVLYFEDCLECEEFPIGKYSKSS